MRVLTEKSWRSFYEKFDPLAVIGILRCSPPLDEALTSRAFRGVDLSCQSALRHGPEYKGRTFAVVPSPSPPCVTAAASRWASEC
jgi:hypothetical protein